MHLAQPICYPRSFTARCRCSLQILDIRGRRKLSESAYRRAFPSISGFAFEDFYFPESSDEEDSESEEADESESESNEEEEDSDGEEMKRGPEDEDDAEIDGEFGAVRLRLLSSANRMCALLVLFAYYCLFLEQ